MKNWFNKLMASVAGRDRTPIVRGSDWRGRPVAKNTGESISEVNLAKKALYATLRLPSSAEASDVQQPAPA